MRIHQLTRNDCLYSMAKYSTYDGRARSSRARDGSVMSNTRRPYVGLRRSHGMSLLMSALKTSAENALELNGADMEDGHKMSVYISNPERKKDRTDSDANDREIYVAGLSRFVTKQDLQTLFKTVSIEYSWFGDNDVSCMSHSMVPSKTSAW